MEALSFIGGVKGGDAPARRLCDHGQKFSDRMGVGVELGYSALTRRDRLERIATAERDRRAGRIDMAVAILGEPTEWPARAVLALARLPESEGEATRA